MIGVPLAGAILVVLAANALSHMFEVKERKHLDPIPIAASACPYVVAMHEAANNFQIAAPIGGFAFDAHERLLTWPETRARLAPALEALELSIVVSKPHFPDRVQHQLALALRETRNGRAQLPLANDGSDFFHRTESHLERGKLAFGYASDLVGERCGVSLGADSSTMLYPFMTTTSAGPA